MSQELNPINNLSKSSNFFKLFLTNYSSKLNKKLIKSEEDINTELNKLVQQLHSLIEPSEGNPNYITTIDPNQLEEEINQNQFNEFGIRAREMLYRDKNGVIKMITELYNKDKQTRFDEWWNYITIENTTYKDNPSFQYIML